MMKEYGEEDKVAGEEEVEDSEVEFLQSLILSILNKHDDISQRDEIIKKLANRLYSELCDKEEIKKSENFLAEELENIKQQVKAYSSLIQNYKDNIKINSTDKVLLLNSNKNNNKTCQCQTDDPLLLFSPSSSPSANVNLEDSLEVCRRQLLPPHHSTMVIDNGQINHNHHPMVIPLSPTKSLSSQLNGSTANTNTITSDDVKCEQKIVSMCMQKNVLDQMKEYQEKFQSERQCYIEENERLNRINEENTKVIDELKCQLKRYSSTLISTTASASSSLSPPSSLCNSSIKNSSNVQHQNRHHHLQTTFIDSSDSSLKG